nr:GAF domain-containing protein [Ensifer sp. BR816]
MLAPRNSSRGELMEQSVLYRFTDRLYRARSMDDVYQASLDAIIDGLGCGRASILRFDVKGVMRFVAWRDLSEAYRQAVGGHSPWRQGDQNAQPIFIGDIDTADITAGLRTTIQKEGIRALAFVPLAIDDKVIGKFMVYFARPHDFTADELQLSLTIARQLGFSIGRHLADENARRWSAVVESSNDAIFTVTWAASSPIGIPAPNGCSAIRKLRSWGRRRRSSSRTIASTTKPQCSRGSSPATVTNTSRPDGSARTEVRWTSR